MLAVAMCVTTRDSQPRIHASLGVSSCEQRDSFFIGAPTRTERLMDPW